MHNKLEQLEQKLILELNKLVKIETFLNKRKKNQINCILKFLWQKHVSNNKIMLMNY